MGRERRFSGSDYSLRLLRDHSPVRDGHSRKDLVTGNLTGHCDPIGHRNPGSHGDTPRGQSWLWLWGLLRRTGSECDYEYNGEEQR